jgi:phage tail tape-measure protein
VASRNVTRVNLLRFSKGLAVVGTVATVYELGDAFVEDNYSFGVHTQRTASGVVGGLAGAYAGAELGATIGLLGGPVGVVVGGIVGGIIGGIIGDAAGREAYDEAF